MNRRLLQLALVISLLWGAVSAGLAQNAHVSPPVETHDPQTTYNLADEREPVTALNGQWRFQPGDDPLWASPTFDDSGWELVRAGEDWEATGYRGLSGTAWYRFRVVLPAGDTPYTLHLPVIYTSYQVFADGRLLLTQGALPPHPSVVHTRPVVVDLPLSPPRASTQTVTIALRVWHAPMWAPYHHGGPQGEVEIGSSELIHSKFDTHQQAYLWQYSDELDLGSLELLATLIALALFLGRRTERELLWFNMLTLGLGAGHLLSAWGHLHVHRVYLLDLWMGAANTLFLASALLFFRAMFRGRWSNFFVFALACCGLGAVLYVLEILNSISVASQNLFALLFNLPVYGWIYLLVRYEARRRQPDARILRGPVLFLFLAFIYSSVVWTLQTYGFPWASGLAIRWVHPYFFTITDVAEVIFLMAMLVILLRRLALRSREQDRVESELEAARSVQQVLVPASLPRLPGLAITTAYHPAQEVGGDFFQILEQPSGATLIVIGDVAGKGLPAALQVSLCVGAVRALAECSDVPGAILAGLNRSLQGRGPGFTTCLALLLSPDRQLLTFANAGHIAPYVNGFELRTEGSLPLGLVIEAEFDEVRYALHEGDHITVLTDGVPEAMHHRELFGFERTTQMSRQTATDIAAAAQRFGQNDDITVLTIDITAVFSASAALPEPILQPA